MCLTEHHARVLLPRLYPVVDASFFADQSQLLIFIDELIRGGATLLQYRNKSGDVRRMIDDACAIRERVADRATLIMNDRADVCLMAEFDGLHVGQEDISSKGARKVIGPYTTSGIEYEPALPVTALRPAFRPDVTVTSAPDTRSFGPHGAMATKLASS